MMIQVPTALTPIDPNAPIDPVAILHDAIEIYHDWKTAGPVVALTLLVYLFTALSKNVAVLKLVPSYWRPYIALLLGIAGGSLSALAAHAHFWPSAVFSGLAAGLGSVAFDQLLTQWKNGVAARLEAKARNSTGGGTGSAQLTTSTVSSKTIGTASAAKITLLLLALTAFSTRADPETAVSKPPPVIQVLPLIEASDPVTPPPPLPVTPSSFGGCNKLGTFCAGPWISVNLIAANLSTGKLEASFTPGVGYGFTLYPGQWYSIGAALVGDANPANQQADIGIIFSVVNGYLHFGLDKAFINDHSWRIPLGLTLAIPL